MRIRCILAHHCEKGLPLLLYEYLSLCGCSSNAVNAVSLKRKKLEQNNKKKLLLKFNKKV